MKVIISRVGAYWKMITEDATTGTVERVFVPTVILKFLLHYLRSKK